MSPKKSHGSAADEYAVSVVETEDVYTLAALIFPACLLKVFEAFAEPTVMGQHLNLRQAKPPKIGESHEVHLRGIAADQLQRRPEDKGRRAPADEQFVCGDLPKHRFRAAFAHRVQQVKGIAADELYHIIAVQKPARTGIQVKKRHGQPQGF